MNLKKLFFISLFFILIGISNSSAEIQSNCAVEILNRGLYQNQNMVSESDTESDIQAWIYSVYKHPPILGAILQCPDIVAAKNEDVIKIGPVEYVFAGGRQIIVNYKATKKILNEKLLLDSKRETANANHNPNPEISENSDGVWTNTDPAWYAILVVQKNSLSDFIGLGKNNTVSLKYIHDNIDAIHPNGYMCTGKSAKTLDNNAVNIATARTVDIPDDTNDYYIAGDANLQWLTWAQVGLDVALTVVTFGGGAVIMGATKAARASRAAKNLVTSIKTLENNADVIKYLDASRRLKQATDANDIDKIKDIGDEIKQLEKLENVKKYQAQSRAFTDVMKVRRALSAWKVPQKGNVVAKSLKTIRAGVTTLRATASTKTINNAAKMGRASMKSGKTKDWLFQNTLKNIGLLGKFQRNVGLAYGVVAFVGDMYDWTSTSSAEYTNNIEFMPLGLLSADDLAGQDNVVNHAMWLMWAGSSTSAADDDAAYLQAMDFAGKFHFMLDTVQAENQTGCDVDIYVVRPVMYHYGDDGNADLYYMVMNDIPWTVSP